MEFQSAGLPYSAQIDQFSTMRTGYQSCYLQLILQYCISERHYSACILHCPAGSSTQLMDQPVQVSMQSTHILLNPIRVKT